MLASIYLLISLLTYYINPVRISCIDHVFILIHTPSSPYIVHGENEVVHVAIFCGLVFPFASSHFNWRVWSKAGEVASLLNHLFQSL